MPTEMFCQDVHVLSFLAKIETVSKNIAEIFRGSPLMFPHAIFPLPGIYAYAYTHMHICASAHMIMRARYHMVNV